MIIQIVLVTMLIFVLGLIWRNSRPINGIDRNLLEAAQGDRELARRLLIRARAKYPEKSQRWYVEKAINELNRDRLWCSSLDNRYSDIALKKRGNIL
ncbi:MAG: hypothetical protein HC847_04520 [Hydrococcus sp. RU_2_2]|jgi:hypothetical protein|nr:hypothetical protein [Hydrococcus sp. RU_2_2]NJP18886.1 hypothetical protein [Hydrococcus sp. CRU_1_1]